MTSVRIGALIRRWYAGLFPAPAARSLWLRRLVVVPLKRLIRREAPVQEGGPPRAEPAATGVRGAAARRSRILIVMHDAPGGVGQTTRDLAAALDGACASFLLLADPHRLRLLRWDRRLQRFVGLREWWRRVPWSATRRRTAMARRLYDGILDDLEVDLVHIRHLLGHTLDLVDGCRERNLPVVYSAHDFYSVCPSIHMLDGSGLFCGGRCPPGGGSCLIPFDWLADLPELTPAFVDEWRADMTGALRHVAHFVTTSPSALELHRAVFDWLDDVPATVVEHGRDVVRRSLAPPPPAPGESVQMLLPGNLATHKGAAFIRALVERDRADGARFQFHFLGPVNVGLVGLGVSHGPYRCDEFPRWIRRVRPHFVGVFSAWPETYSHVVTEAWSQGIPVLVSPMGALGERVRRHGGGWVLPVDDVNASYRLICEIADDSAGYRRRAEEASNAPIPGTATMGKRYLHIYRGALRGDQAREPSRALQIGHEPQELLDSVGKREV